MAQPNVAREPSMEEILASIRRIIESNEPETANDELARLAAMEIAEPEVPGAVMEDIRLTIEDELASFVPPRPVQSAPAPQNQPVERPVVAVQPRPQPQPTSAVVPPVAANAAADMPAASARRDEEPRSISLADVAARVRAASERSEGARPVVATAEAPRPVEMKSQPVIRTVEPAMRQETPPMSIPALEDGMDALARTAQELPELDLDLDLAADTASTDLQEPQIDPAPEHAESRGSLVSRETGDQVARSFHELAEMVQMTAQRSLDDIAGEMLRPMLQEWLDDNLPTLVERLVREEIERVARGPRR